MSDKNVITALSAVMAELPGIGKTERSQQGYQYRGIEAITAAAQPLFAKHGVVFTPHVEGRRVKEFQLGKGTWTEDELVVRYTVYGPGGPEDKIEVGPIFGLGRDNSDKGAVKAMTQAYKYALLQTLCIGDSLDDADGERAHEADAQPSQQAPSVSVDPLISLYERLGEPEREQFKLWWRTEGLPSGGGVHASLTGLPQDKRAQVADVLAFFERGDAVPEPVNLGEVEVQGETLSQPQVEGNGEVRSVDSETGEITNVPVRERLRLAFMERGYRNADKRNAYAAEVVGHRVGAMTDLDENEAAVVLASLLEVV